MPTETPVYVIGRCGSRVVRHRPQGGVFCLPKAHRTSRSCRGGPTITHGHTPGYGSLVESRLARIRHALQTNYDQPERVLRWPAAEAGLRVGVCLAPLRFMSLPRLPLLLGSEVEVWRRTSVDGPIPQAAARLPPSHALAGLQATAAGSGPLTAIRALQRGGA